MPPGFLSSQHRGSCSLAPSLPGGLGNALGGEGGGLSSAPGHSACCWMVRISLGLWLLKMPSGGIWILTASSRPLNTVA